MPLIQPRRWLVLNKVTRYWTLASIRPNDPDRSSPFVPNQVLVEMLKFGISVVFLRRESADGGKRLSERLLIGAFPRVPFGVLASYSSLAVGYSVNNQLTYYILKLVSLYDICWRYGAQYL